MKIAFFQNFLFRNVLGAAILFALAVPSFAVEYTWTGTAGDGLWVTPGNWSPATSTAGPVSGDIANITMAGAMVKCPGSESLPNLVINLSDATLNPTGHMKLRSGSELNITGSGCFDAGASQLQPGEGATITIDGAGAKLTTSYLQIAHEVAGKGTVTLKNGDVNVTSVLYVGNHSAGGMGYFYQSGGTVTTPNVTIGRNSGATGEYHLSGGTLTAPTLRIGNVAGATGRLYVSGGTLNAKNIAASYATSEIYFEQNSGNFLKGITCTGTASLSQGTLYVNVSGMQPVNTATDYNLISGGVGTLGMNVVSDFYDVVKSGANLTARLKNDLPTEYSTIGQVMLEDNEATLYTNYWDNAAMQDTLMNWLEDSNENLTATAVADGGILLQLANLTGANALLWNLADFNAKYNTNALFSQTSQVPEPAAWLLMMLGLGLWRWTSRRRG